MTRKQLKKLSPGSAEYVVAHAKWRMSRGKKPSMKFNGERDAKLALMFAKRKLSFNTAKFLKGSIEFIKQLKVRQGGRIFPFGVIRTLLEFVNDDPTDEFAGLQYWHPDLVAYGDGKYYAKINGTFEILCIFEKETGNRVKVIPLHEMSCVEVHTATIMRGGFLCRNGVIGGKFQPESSYNDTMLSSLRNAVRGLRPTCVLDNSLFCRVKPWRYGQELIWIRSGYGPSNQVSVVLTLDGKRVWFEADSWLSFAKWEPTNRLAQYAA